MTLTNLILAIISGVLLVFSFAPFDCYFLAWFALVPLLVSIRTQKPFNAFLLGLIMGLVYFAGTTYWVYNSVHNYGHFPPVVSVFLVAILSFYLSLYVGVFSLLFNHILKRTTLPSLIVAPLLWVTLEFLRTYIFTGFPWSSLGYSQYNCLILIQIADITGIYGISFFVACLNGALFDVYHYVKRRHEKPLFSEVYTLAGFIFLALFVAATVAYGYFRLNANPLPGKTLKISLIQGNISQDKKWDKAFQNQVMETFEVLTRESLDWSPQLIIWPETSLPFILGGDEELTDQFLAFQKKLNTYLLVGATTAKIIDSKNYFLGNSAILFSPEGKAIGVYDKIHLVPFGEYVPLKRFLSFFNALAQGMGEIRPGEELKVMDMIVAKFSPVICYEIIFPGLVRQFANEGAEIIVTITNDAWFDISSAPYQHFSMAVLRAVENRMPVARAANTGISGFIDAKGHIVDTTDLFVEAVLSKEITFNAFNKSFYTLYGDMFSFVCIVLSFLIIVRHYFHLTFLD
jgi:apolipoprotein N-acyltransferase